jgi:hypothetical protein
MRSPRRRRSADCTHCPKWQKARPRAVFELAGRVYGLVVHGDVAGVESLRRALSDWLDWMGLVNAGATAHIDRMLGYYEP